MLEISAKDIAQLEDDDLRSLVGLLCEAETRRQGSSPSCVTWSGHQDAKDGGLDVRVELTRDVSDDGYVPRAVTGFQVKKPDLPPAKISLEMRPHGKLRPVISELANRSGAYIIVSSGASTSDTALGNRRAAMARAISELPNAADLKLDFYDCGRIASWVRSHVCLIPWVKQRVGRPMGGWRSHGAWAYAPEGVDADYLLDNTARVQTFDKDVGSGFDVLAGLENIRHKLAAPPGVVRLVGLSGVGKTRFAQALFDSRVGDGSLDPSLAMYTNIADEPDPQPSQLVTELIVARERAIIVVDNCNPELHRRLSELCRQPGSTVSLLTIEYDIRDDQPEGTDVFELQPSSKELIEKLIHIRFPAVSQIDAKTIAEFSGGNARIAIALAATLGKNESIAGLNDEELFHRLFQQRHYPDPSLLLAAQACSLVYSFDGHDTSNAAELGRLGKLVGKTPEEMFRDVAELQQRDLVQQRGVWRAILPQAVANRLAGVALQKIPSAAIHEFIDTVPERLLRSFSRRLGYLHDSSVAKLMVRKMLEAGGLLENVASLNDLGRAMLTNVAPVEPELALLAIERAFESETKDTLRHCTRYAPLLRSLAYEPELFDRCARLLVVLAAASSPDEMRQVQEAFTSLFTLLLSGTHATVEQRLAIVESLLSASDKPDRELGIAALKAVLEAWHFAGFRGFEFGARSRDFGFWPRTAADVEHWFSSALKLCERIGCAEIPVAREVRDVLAHQFRGLWTKAHVYEELCDVSRAFAEKRFWADGWIAVRTTQHYDSDGSAPEVIAKLSELEQSLRPRDLIQRVRSVVLSDGARLYLDVDIEDQSAGDIQGRYARLELTAQTLGAAIASDEGAFSDLLPELVTTDGRLWSFGRGLVEGAANFGPVWDRLVTQFSLTNERERKLQILCGCVSALRGRTPELVESILEAAVGDPTLGPFYPILQAYAGIAECGVDRLIRSLGLGLAPMDAYGTLMVAIDSISGADFLRVIREIAAKPNGFAIAVQLVESRLQSEKNLNVRSTPEVIAAGHELLRGLTFTTNDHGRDYQLGDLVARCLTDEADAPIAQEICRKLKDALSDYRAHLFDCSYLLGALLTAQPVAALDGLFADSTEEPEIAIRVLNRFDLLQNPFDRVPQAELLRWCDQRPTYRYPLMAAAVTAFREGENAGPVRFTATALRLLEKAPNRIEVVKAYIRQFHPSSRSGSRAAIVERNSKLLDELETYPDADVVKFSAAAKARIRLEIENERRQENAEDRIFNERFE